MSDVKSLLRRVFLILLIASEITALTFFALSGLWMWVFGIGGCFLSVGIFEVVSKLKYGKTMSSYLTNMLKNKKNVAKILVALGCFLFGMVALILHLVIA